MSGHGQADGEIVDSVEKVSKVLAGTSENGAKIREAVRKRGNQGSNGHGLRGVYKNEEIDKWGV